MKSQQNRIELVTRPENVSGATVDQSVTGDHRVSGIGFVFQPEVPTGVLHEHVVLHEGASVTEDLDPLPGR